MNRTTRIETSWNKSPILDSKIGHYTVIAQLARGGTASVYLCEDSRTGARLALKLLDPVFADRTEIVERFLAEHVVSQAVRHPGVIDVVDSGKTESGVPYIVMEFLDGESLATLADRGLIDFDAVLAIGTQIASAVSALHRNGFIHCDIKPDNVFVMYEKTTEGFPEIKVIDYGVSRKVADTQGEEEGTIAGTPAYMPTEQWRGKPTTKSDVYSLGCCLYELLTGDQPFHGTLPQLMILHSEQLPQRPSTYRSEIPGTLEALIMRMLAKDPSMRPTMDEVEYSLARLAWHRRSQTRRDLAPMFVSREATIEMPTFFEAVG